MNAKGNPLFHQERAYYLIAPGRMAEFKYVPPSRGQLSDEIKQPFLIPVPMGRQLVENRARMALKSLDSGEEASQSLLRLFPSLDVGQVTTGFDGIEETGWRLLAPGGERLLFRQMIERVVDLDRVEELEVVIKPVFHRQFRRIKDFPPMLIHPTGGADMNLAGRGRLGRQGINCRAI